MRRDGRKEGRKRWVIFFLFQLEYIVLFPCFDGCFGGMKKRRKEGKKEEEEKEEEQEVVKGRIHKKCRRR